MCTSIIALSVIGTMRFLEGNGTMPSEDRQYTDPSNTRSSTIATGLVSREFEMFRVVSIILEQNEEHLAWKLR